ncbi:MAG: hypothetical protein QM757_26035 [Paludibaculum sp.]
MSAQANRKSSQRSVVTVFTAVLLFNVVLAVLALATAFAGRQPFTLLPEDTGMAVKVGLVLLVTFLAWCLGRWLYLQMLNGDYPPDQGATGALVLAVYLVLLFFGAVFVGAALWVWLVVLMLIMILIALFGLRAVVSTTAAIIIILLCLAAGAALYYYLTA